MQSVLGGSADSDLAGFDDLQQHVSDLRVELPARLGADFFEDPVPRSCASIGPVAAHRREGIAGMDDARLDRDLLTAKPVWVATAIPSFMLRADDGADAAKEGHRGDDAFTNHRVFPHDGRFLLIQRSRFVEDVPGDADLADIAQQGAILQEAQRLVLETEPPADGPRQRCRLPW